MIDANAKEMSHLVRKPNNVVSEQVRHKSGYTVTETLNFGFEKKRKCTIYVAKTKVLISFVVTAKLICIFVFAYIDCWFSHEVAQMCNNVICAIYVYRFQCQSMYSEIVIVLVNQPSRTFAKCFSYTLSYCYSFFLAFSSTLPV